jgi:GTP-binding protein YchF
MAALSLYLMGAPGCGKTAVFEALTNTPEGPHFSTKGAHRLGTVKVPDPRLVALRDMYKPKRFSPAETTFVDIGLPTTGADTNKLSQLTGFLSEADAFVLVVQAFGEFDGLGNPVDPVRQLESVLLELVVSDLEKLERRFEKIEKERVRGTHLTPDSEIKLLEQCRDLLEQEQHLRQLELNEEDAKLLRGYGFLSQKPVLVVANVDETRVDGSGLEDIERVAGRHDLQWLSFCAPLEADIAQLGEDEQAAFLEDYGLAEPASIRLIQAAYRLMDLVSFFTVGDDEVKAWTIRRGTAAQQAAGKIHSDIERGFIRAETVPCDELLKTQSWAACREAATLRLEGKTYIVQDGDVINFRFST